MSLKFKRNLPLIIMLVAFLSFLIIAMRALPIIAYNL